MNTWKKILDLYDEKITIYLLFPFHFSLEFFSLIILNPTCNNLVYFCVYSSVIPMSLKLFLFDFVGNYLIQVC